MKIVKIRNKIAAAEVFCGEAAQNPAEHSVMRPCWIEDSSARGFYAD
jgi:hypothetical protein